MSSIEVVLGSIDAYNLVVLGSIDVVLSSIERTSWSIDEVFGSIQTDNVVLNLIFL